MNLKFSRPSQYSLTHVETSTDEPVQRICTCTSSWSEDVPAGVGAPPLDNPHLYRSGHHAVPIGPSIMLYSGSITALTTSFTTFIMESCNTQNVLVESPYHYGLVAPMNC